MAYIIETPNALQPLIGIKKHRHPGGVSIRQWLEWQYPGFSEFETPTICLLNGKPLLRRDWNKEIKEKDIVNFIGIVGEVVTISLIIAAVVAVVSLAVSLYLVLSLPGTPGEAPASDPVFTLKGQSNAIRLGEPIECHYGRNRIWPSLASIPFYRYIDNDQFQHSLFCIGQGEYEIEAIQIGDTDIDDFEEVEYEVIGPGGTTDLFRLNVVTSAEAGGQTLFAQNEPEFTGDGWVGPFVTNPSGTVVDRIQIDLSYPKGIYHQSKKDGDIESNDVHVLFQKRRIDDAGAPLEAFSTLIDYELIARTTTPQRKTRGSGVITAARYEVRGKNVGFANDPTRNGDTVVWEGMRGFVVGGEPDFGNVTLLAVKIKATNNLNARTQERFNVIATRKLPVLDSTGGGASDSSFTDVPVATRSIVWAFVDIFRSIYGARITDERFLDLAALEELDAFYESRNEHFDWTFRDPITVWEAAKTVARVGRAIPLVSGSVITMKRDGPLEVPVTLFSPDNIVKGSFSWEIKLWEPFDNDSIRVEYTEPSTGYKQETVLCILPDSDATSDAPADLRIPGIQDRDHAYHEGLYVLASQRYLRENISFETGMEGFIPSYGDLVAVSHDVPRWGQSGYILAVEDESSGYFRLHVSEPLSFAESGQIYQILLRGKAGEIVGPFTAIETADSRIVEIQMPEDSVAFDFLLGGTTEPMLFLFGVAGTGTKYGRVVRIEPQGGERIKITLVGEEPIIHQFDGLTAPALDQPAMPPVIPDAPTIQQLTLSQIASDQLIVQASWLAAFGAQYYIVQWSLDGEHWTLVGNTERTSIQFQVSPGVVQVRVAAVNNGQGPWIQEEIAIGLVAGLHESEPWDDDLEWEVTWWPKINADGWVVRVYNNMDPENPILERTTNQIAANLDYEYDYTDAVTDSNLVRRMKAVVDVRVLNDDTGLVEESGFPSEIELSNPIPAPPIHLGHELIGEESPGPGIVYRLFWDNPAEVDLIRVKVWISLVDISAFDEDDAILVFDDTAGSPGYLNVAEEAFVTLPEQSSGGNELYYWWVAVFDVWGNEITSNISDPAVIPAFP